MPKPLNPEGVKAAKAYAKIFIEQYELAVAGIARKLLAKGIGRSASKATGTKFTGVVRTAFPDKKRGCMRAEVKIHPHEDVKSEMGGTDADPNVPAALPVAKPIFPGEVFISGHIINAEFGGAGDDPGNQTILVSGANSQHHFDEHVKAAWYQMTKAWEELSRFATGSKGQAYMEDLQKNWAIHVVGVVDASSWYDKYISDPVLKSNATVKKKYPLDCISTKVVFTAKELNGPTEDDIAKNLKIDDTRTDQLARHLSTFREHLSQASQFVVTQAAPPTLAGRSSVLTEVTDGNGTKTAVVSTASAKTIKPKKGKSTLPKAPVKKTVQPYFTTTTGATIDLNPKDDEIGYETTGYPWTTAADTDLIDDVIFTFATSTSGTALVALEPGVKTKVEVNGARLRSKAMELSPGDVVSVYDSQAPNADERYDLTYGEK
jgi:hypothetical protein